MKKIIIALAVLAAAALCAACINESKSDISVRVSTQLEDWTGDAAEGIAYIAQGSELRAAFGTALVNEGFEASVQDYFILRGQTDNKKAEQMIEAACSKAKAGLSDFSPKKKIVVNVDLESSFGKKNYNYTFE